MARYFQNRVIFTSQKNPIFLAEALREYLKGKCMVLHVSYIYYPSFHNMSCQQFDLRKRNHIYCCKDCRLQLFLHSVSSDSQYARL